MGQNFKQTDQYPLGQDCVMSHRNPIPSHHLTEYYLATTSPRVVCPPGFTPLNMHNLRVHSTIHMRVSPRMINCFCPGLSLKNIQR